MPKNFDMNAYNEATPSTGGGDYQRMPAGGYVVRIQAVRTKGKDSYGRDVDYPEDKQYVKLIYDIDEGDFAGKYSDEYWSGEDKDYGHQIYLSWKNMGAFKGSIQAIEESNPGFDAMAAFTADQWTLFIGKRVGIVLGEEEYMGNDGSVKTRFTFPRLKSVDDIHNGKFRVPALKTLDGNSGGGSSTPAPAAAAPKNEQAPTGVYDDVPF